MWGARSRFKAIIPREPWCVKSTGLISGHTSIELFANRLLQSMFFVPMTTGFSFFLCLRIVKWSGWFNYIIKLASNFDVPCSPSNSKTKVSLKAISQAALTCLLWYLSFKKLTAIDICSSSLGLTKSTNALAWTILQHKCLLFGSSDFKFLKFFFVEA